jgi:hypothetical protein
MKLSLLDENRDRCLTRITILSIKKRIEIVYLIYQVSIHQPKQQVEIMDLKMKIKIIKYEKDNY